MSQKRHADESVTNVKRTKSETDEVAKREELIRRARERVQQLRSKPTKTEPKEQSQTTQNESKLDENKGRGLNVELHPLLTGEVDTLKHLDNPNLTKLNKRGFAINPYLDSISTSRPKREFHFNEPGKYIEEANQLRRQEKLEQLKRKIQEKASQSGLTPDVSIGEDLYKVDAPPRVEWWDEPFLIDGDYSQINYDSVSIYIQHPIPINAPWERHLPVMKPLYLTKKEMKRIRRNRRAEEYKNLQDRIKLGLEAAPKPKVKLNNLMNALTNEAIKDPTLVEKRVRKEIEERRLKHEQMNEERKLSKEAKHEKIRIKQEKDLDKGYFTNVFILNKLKHPSHKFKVDTNAKQLNLVGTILYTNEFVLIIVEGGEKSLKFYKKLLLKRIKWDESVQVGDEHIDLTNNKCELLWEGQLKDLHFKKWSFFHADTEDIAIDYLKRFQVDNYYRMAKTHGSV